jgi:hypothetical protein
MRAVTVERVGMDVEGDNAVVLLRDSESKKVLPIWIGMVEATAIALKLQQQEPPRPLTVDLLKTVLDSVDAKVLMVVVNDMRDRTYFARIFVRANTNGSTTLELDARPSDSIGLALRTGAPIYVADWILDEAGVDAVIEDVDSSEDEETRQH